MPFIIISRTYASKNAQRVREHYPSVFIKWPAANANSVRPSRPHGFVFPINRLLSDPSLFDQYADLSGLLVTRQFPLFDCDFRLLRFLRQRRRNCYNQRGKSQKLRMHWFLLFERSMYETVIGRTGDTESFTFFRIKVIIFLSPKRLIKR
ncbi:hypothetical protein MKK64_04955 [Methylobacterium sp. E-025]|uniref:hypothetical protein n=1 Tax=Methylobacterium sp. E-025 TaxID=2836561 RepID=UPI001FBB59A6|nr:hypothetical protein [Methylobacterium sp. E-025]MCJ2110556.1 hypothetical protein [Methylobacterium sp. E-025]